MVNINITTTATLRPELLDRTYNSFCNNLFGSKPSNCRLIINIDPVGGNYSKYDVLDVAHKYFDYVTYNVSKEPSFPKAWKWCWDQVNSGFVFHLEEDWELLRPVQIEDMMSILDRNKHLATLRMLKMNVPGNLTFFRSKYLVKDGFLQAQDRSVSFGGNPQLIKGVFVEQARKYLLVDRNPEKQFRVTSPDLWENVVSKWDYGVYTREGYGALVKDIGREWRRKHGFDKAGGAGFTTWEKIK